MKLNASIICIAIFFAAVGCTKKYVTTIIRLTDTVTITQKDTPATSTYVDFYIMAGQSNCGRPQWPGTGETGPVATDSEKMIYDSVITGFQIYNSIYDSQNFHDMQAGVNTMLINYILPTEMGPEVSFFKAVKDSSNTKSAYMVKYGVGSTDLATWWLNTGEWQLYRYVDKAIHTLLKGNKIPILRGFIWMQGENDATDSVWASQYQNNLQNFFDQFNLFYSNEIFSNGLPDSSMNYKKVIGRINGALDVTEIYRNLVRTGEENFVLQNTNSFLINTDNYPLFEDVHYTLAGQIQFGKDIYSVIK